MSLTAVAGDGPKAAGRTASALVARREALPLAGACAAVGILLGTNACAAGPPRPGQVFRDCEVCPEMVVIPSEKSFIMGSPASEEGRDDDEGPRRLVTIGYSLAVGVYEVSFAEWDACLAGGGCLESYRPGGELAIEGGYAGEIGEDPSEPVVKVSWDDARRYVDWLSEETGAGYRLLSEAEWEYAARAGTETPWYWPGGLFEACRYENTDRGSSYYLIASPAEVENMCLDGFYFTAPVGSFAPNPWGLYDMLGNAAEWTEDCWHENYMDAPTDGSAWVCPGERERRWRVVRRDSYPRPRSADRERVSYDSRRSGTGFRVARSVD